MTYTIGQVADMYDIPISTLRYYDKEGLFPNMERTSGIRKFTDVELDSLHIIECLKRSGLEIKEIKQFMEWCAEGPSTYEKRRDLFLHQKERLQEEMDRLARSMAMIQFKCWFYDAILQDGTEEKVRALMPDKLPAEVQAWYDLAHEGDEEKKQKLAAKTA